MSRELLERLSRHGAAYGDEPMGSTIAGAGQVSMDTRRSLYRNSHLGGKHGVRQMGAEIAVSRPSRRPNPRPDDAPQAPGKVDTGQNRPSAGFHFQEPQGRKYDPYG